jgi:hypothetical protein
MQPALDVGWHYPPFAQHPGQSPQGFEEPGTSVGILRDGAQQTDRTTHGAGDWPPQPSKLQVVTNREPPRSTSIPDGGGMVIGRYVPRVGETPPGGGKVDDQQFRLAPEDEPGNEASYIQVRRAPDDRSAGQETEHRSTGQVRLDRQETGGHLGADGILLLRGTDKYTGSQQTQPRVRLEEISSLR